jgi:hypothetical protein
VDTGKKAILPKSRLENIEGALLMFGEDARPTKLAQLRLSLGEHPKPAIDDPLKRGQRLSTVQDVEHDARALHKG